MIYKQKRARFKAKEQFAQADVGVLHIDDGRIYQKAYLKKLFFVERKKNRIDKFLDNM